MTILVTGARGNIGGRVATRLSESGFRVRGSARDAATLSLPAGVEAVDLDITDPTTVDKALADVETVFLYPVLGEAEAFLAAAAKAGVRHIVQLSSPASYEPHEFDARIGQVHQAMEQALADSGIAHTVLYPSWLATNTIRDWSQEIRTHNRLSIAFADGNFTPIHIDDVAEVAVNLLTKEDFRGRMQIITGPQSLRQREVVDILAEVRGAPIAIEDLTRDEAIAQCPEWIPVAVMESLLEVAEASVGVPALVNNNVERITGHPAKPFRQWAQEHRTSFTA